MHQRHYQQMDSLQPLNNLCLDESFNKINYSPPVEILVETRASKLTKLEFGPRKLSGVLRVRAAIVSGDRVELRRVPFPKNDPS